jgi:hypothetical protein
VFKTKKVMQGNAELYLRSDKYLGELAKPNEHKDAD